MDVFVFTKTFKLMITEFLYTFLKFTIKQDKNKWSINKSMMKTAVLQAC